MKILAVTSEAIGPETIRGALGGDARDAQVRVVAPALNESRLAFWVSDPDDAIEEAEQVQRESVSELRDEGVPSAGESGESDPLVAIGDALATFEADRVIVFMRPEGDRRYRESGWIDDARERFAVPIDCHVLDEAA